MKELFAFISPFAHRRHEKWWWLDCDWATLVPFWHSLMDGWTISFKVLIISFLMKELFAFISPFAHRSLEKWWWLDCERPCPDSWFLFDTYWLIDTWYNGSKLYKIQAFILLWTKTSFPWAREWVSERTSKYARRSAWAKRDKVQMDKETLKWRFKWTNRHVQCALPLCKKFYEYRTLPDKHPPPNKRPLFLRFYDSQLQRITKNNKKLERIKNKVF